MAKMRSLWRHIAKLMVVMYLIEFCGCAGIWPWKHSRKVSALVEEQPLVLQYHNGPLLKSDIDVHLIWYGKFSPAQRSVVGDFIQSLGEIRPNGDPKPRPSVADWWKTTDMYKDSSNNILPKKAVLGKQKLDEAYSLGKSLKRIHIEALVKGAVSSRALPRSSNAVYLVLTSEDVSVERFCVSSCGYHATLPAGSSKSGLPYAWVGNSAMQCPGLCAWPFHQPLYGPQTAPLVAPNGDVGADGMIINIATVLVGAVTNPFNTGYFQGDAAAPLEGVSACPGIYGRGAYPGYPGQLPVDETTGASYNAHGINDRKFLLPAIWDPLTFSCKTAAAAA